MNPGTCLLEHHSLNRDICRKEETDFFLAGCHPITILHRYEDEDCCAPLNIGDRPLASLDAEILKMLDEIDDESVLLSKEVYPSDTGSCKSGTTTNSFGGCKPGPPRSCAQPPSKRRRTRKKKARKVRSPIPPDFEPLPYSVIVGKGKEAKDNVGNLRLRVLASTYLSKYAEACDNKTKKSKIVSRLVADFHEACPEGAFIRLGKDGKWCRVSDPVAREKVGYTFRELLGDKYRSSSKAKAAMRYGHGRHY